MSALEQLIDLPQRARRPSSDVLDLLEVPALRSRFGIAEDALPLMQRWIRRRRVRWGLHAGHRRSLGLPDAPEGNTWLFGLRRMLLGYAVGATGGAWHDIEPFDEIGGLDAALLGPLVQLVERLDAHLAGLLHRRHAGRMERPPAPADRPTSSPPTTAPTPSPCSGSTQALARSAGTPAPQPASTARCRRRWWASTGWPSSTTVACRNASFAGTATCRHPHADARHPSSATLRLLLGLNDGDYPRTRACRLTST